MEKNTIMDLLTYANKWLTGEIHEDMAIVVAGVVLLILSILAWRFGTSASMKATIIPLLVAAVVLIGLGGSLAYNNLKRVEQFKQAYQESPQMFLESEKVRVAEFMKIYPQTIIFSSVMMVVGVCLFAFCVRPWVRASALVLILVALTALAIDFFSKERGIIYQNELNSIQVDVGQ